MNTYDPAKRKAAERKLRFGGFMVAVAQPGRAPDCGSGRRGFKSRRSPQLFFRIFAKVFRMAYRESIVQNRF